LAIEVGRCETVVLKKAVRRDLTSEELDQKFRELIAGQKRVNTRMAIEQIVELKWDARKGAEKDVVPRLRMMRVEGETGDSNRLPPVSVMLGTEIRGDGAPRSVENMKAVGRIGGERRS